MQVDDAPLIIAFVGDLFFTPRITSVGEATGFTVQVIERAGEIVPIESGVPVPQSTTILDGPGAALLEYLTLNRPALIIFDLNNQEIPGIDQPSRPRLHARIQCFA
jgi:hypothetical protein